MGQFSVSVYRLQELLDAAAQHGPVFLLEGEVPAKIEHGDLAHLAANALTAHQTIGKVTLAGGAVVGTSLTDKQAPDANGKARGKSFVLKYYGTTK